MMAMTSATIINLYPPYGSLEDFHTLVQEAHQRNLRIMVELVPNHTSDQHAWFQASCDPAHPDHARYRDYYVWSDTDQRYSSARIIFLDYEKSNWSLPPTAQGLLLASLFLSPA